MAFIVVQSDAGTGSDVSPIGGIWSTCTGQDNIRRLSDQIRASTDGVDAAYMNTGTFTADQYCQADAALLKNGYQAWGLICRYSTGMNAYMLSIGGPSSGSGTSTFQFGKWTGPGSYSGLGSQQTGRTINSGATILFSVTGTTNTILTCYINGVADGYTYTDSSSPILTGVPGIEMEDTIAVAMINYFAGNVGASANITGPFPVFQYS